jgi:TfoX C-terminal domain
MPTPLTDIRNIGPAFAEALMRADIADAETLRDLGADAAYTRLLQTGTRPHFIGYYVLHMALQGRPWNDCQGKEKRSLRAGFDALKAQCVDQGQSEFERALNEIGVITRR